MKSFPIIVQFPDNYSDVDVLHSIVNNLPIGDYMNIGIHFSVNNVLNDQLKERLNQLGLMELAKPSNVKS